MLNLSFEIGARTTTIQTSQYLDSEGWFCKPLNPVTRRFFIHEDAAVTLSPNPSRGGEENDLLKNRKICVDLLQKCNL